MTETGVIEYRAPDASGYEFIWTKRVPRTPLNATIDMTLETLFPEGFRFPSGWFVVLDGKGVGTPGWNGVAPFNLDCTEGHWTLRIKGAGTPGPTNTAPMSSYVQTDFPLGQAKTGSVDRIRIRMKVAVLDGNVEVWRDGKPVAAKQGFPTTYTGTVDREWWVGGYTDGNKNPGWGPFRSKFLADGRPGDMDVAGQWGSTGATAKLVGPDWADQPPVPDPIGLRVREQTQRSVTLEWVPQPAQEGFVPTIDGDERLTDGKRHPNTSETQNWVTIGKKQDGRKHRYGVKILGAVAESSVEA